MNDFKTIQDTWENQQGSKMQPTAEELAQKARAYTKQIKRKHLGIISVLLTTLFMLTGYFIWIDFYRMNLFTFGLGWMAGMLLFRIGLEVISYRELGRIAPGLSLNDYIQSAVVFYNRRKKIHFILTPIIYVSYFLGFALILPVLKKSLNPYFFIYIIISGIVIFVGLGFFIFKQIKRELDLIAYLTSLETD